MKLRNRLERLESLLRAPDEHEDSEQKTKEYVSAWMSEPEGRSIFKQFEDHCRKSGAPYNPKIRWVELTRTDPVAEALARKYLESYRSFVFKHFGVEVEEVGEF